MRKILGLTVAAMLVMGLVGVGTWAFFSDTETASGNTLVAGTLNLQLTDSNETAQDGVTASFSGSTLAPGDSVGPATITLVNAGSITADHAEIKFTLDVTDNAAYNAADLGVNIADMSTVMVVSTLSYGGTSLLTQTNGDFDNADIEAADVNNDDVISLDELDGVAIGSLGAPAANNGTKDFIITVNIPSTVGNGIQGDAVDVTIDFGIFQDSSQSF